jgi:hypothetical protein
MTTGKKAEANRRNALRSTGPKTGEGLLACKSNALRHGLRAVQTVVPGEDPGEWEAHRAAVVADLRPEGAVELALAEDVAVKLWRLGRVVRYEADLIANAQAPDELALAHEKAHRRVGYGGRKTADIPTFEDVTDARQAAEKSEKKVADWERAVGVLDALDRMSDDDLIPATEWGVYQALMEDLELEEGLDSVFKGEEDFVARHVRMMLRKRGTVEEMTAWAQAHWRTKKLPELQSAAAESKEAYEDLLSRYETALERRRRAHGLPGAKDLDRVQRYEAHLERGLHRALDRLRDLQEGRGAVAPRPPSVAVAVVQTGCGGLSEAPVGPFGRNALEGPGGVREGSEGAAQG